MTSEESQQTEQQRESMVQELAISNIKSPMLFSQYKSNVTLDPKGIVALNDNTSASIYYNHCRITSIISSYQEAVGDRQDQQQQNTFTLEDYKCLNDKSEWKLFASFALNINCLLDGMNVPGANDPTVDIVQDRLATQSIYEFINLFVREYSRYYTRKRVLRNKLDKSVIVRIEMHKVLSSTLTTCMALIGFQPSFSRM
ncbi:hypothetical protein SAMD00019534_093480 [Acytostelium subglobosum LB1]|uniref:hypothetical protein n=1 Tax=Acytostelium subglobosum LB1 TaxID=1410327 RepID=UPI000644934C|nr:hypothetical protein SAMD00019534_093480 [Acytostelium subglobosum LB1]GAM26173.1 hypothetical protein SAMD00019534_093480 [Acytostelium subglobosum LB1]|eukprot:XP_012750727.1 hypothetical protein SAMD00019534_093480 [Acytostelium subglobosum LB1]